MSDSAGEVLRRAVSDGQIPGAVFAAGAPGQAAEVVAVGHAQLLGGPRRAMHRGTLFDLASLTKVVATLPAVLRLADRGELALDDPACRFLPGFRGDGREAVTVRQLLAHTSGLPAEAALRRCCRDPAQARRALLTVAPERPPGRRVRYSDVGFMLLGLLTEAATGAPFDASVRELVTEPLGMSRTRFFPNAASGGPDAAATEPQPGGTALTGVVHDENARFLGGVAGHAGLFAPADDLARYLELAWLGGADGFLSPASRRAACGLQTEGLDGRRGLGWVLRGDQADFLGGWPDGSVSHTGFTGTSLAFDPDTGNWAALLTNEVHLGRGRGVIRALRESVHQARARTFA